MWEKNFFNILTWILGWFTQLGLTGRGLKLEISSSSQEMGVIPLMVEEVLLDEVLKGESLERKEGGVGIFAQCKYMPGKNTEVFQRSFEILQ